MSNKRGAVIGIGGIGTWHGQMMRETGRIDVVALCDNNEKMKDKATENFPGVPFYTSPEAMLKAEKPDVVALAVPHDLHAPIAITALNAGANVIVEKPMATRYADCLAMIAAAKANDRFLTVFHNRRLDGWFLAAQSVIASGLLGDIFEYDIAINYRPSPATWRGYKGPNGGLLYDWGAHLVDYALHFAQSEVRAVSGFYYRSPKTDPAYNEDHGTVRIHFVSGAIANITISAVDLTNPSRYRIIGDRGTLVDEWQWNDTDKLKVTTRLGGGELTTMEVTYQKTVTQKYYDDIADALCTGAAPAVTAESAAKIIDIFNTAERSHDQGGVPLPLEGATVSA